MRVVAVIPARGGSKGVPGKNLRTVGGIPLVVRAVRSALACPLIDAVHVSTDDAAIAAAALVAGAEIVDRPRELSGDQASSESALLHALDQMEGPGGDPEILVFLQATSPFIDSDDLTAAIERVQSGAEDAVFSAVETHDFLWRGTPDGLRGVNHEHPRRPLRQEREPELRETGAFYVLRTAGFRAAGIRFFGRIGAVLVDPRSAVDVDRLDELELARQLAPLFPEARPVLDVDAVVTDFDGVHTDDTALLGLDGAEQVRVSRADGMGVRLLREAGIPVLILSSEEHPIVGARAAKLRVEVRHGIRDKAQALRIWAAERGIPLHRIAYLGNDLNDLGCLGAVGWPVAMPGSPLAVLRAARHVLSASGGAGAVRELADLVLAARAPERQIPSPTTPQTLPPPHHPITRGRTMSVSIGANRIGDGEPVYVIAEIGLNHNGSVERAKQLIDVAAEAGAQAVKFQKRTPDIATPEHMKNTPRDTPWGRMTYLEYRHRVEFDRDDYAEIADHATMRGLDWFASPWDVPSVAFLEELGVPAHKVASASVTDSALLEALAATGKPIILSTGMSTIEQIDRAVDILEASPLVILHATSTYPLPPEEANLRTISTLRGRYPGVPVGYSGHERGLQISLAAVALGAVAVERHITLDRTLWGSDHAASLEPKGLDELVRDIRIVSEALGDGEKRIFPGELAPLAKLRRVPA